MRITNEADVIIQTWRAAITEMRRVGKLRHDAPFASSFTEPSSSLRSSANASINVGRGRERCSDGEVDKWLAIGLLCPGLSAAANAPRYIYTHTRNVQPTQICSRETSIRPRWTRVIDPLHGGTIKASFVAKTQTIRNNYSRNKYKSSRRNQIFYKKKKRKK